MSNPRKVVLIACGSYNPPTIVHLRLFEMCRDHLEKSGNYTVIGGIISPVNDGYGKKDLVSAKHRCEMLRRAVSTSDWIRLDTWESDQPQWVETAKVLRHHRQMLDEQYQPSNRCSSTQIDKQSEDNSVCNNNNKGDSDHVELKLLCGGDLLESFATPGLWTDEDIEDIVKNYGLVCCTRKGSDVRKFIYESDLLTMYESNIHIVTRWIETDFSSTVIRRVLRRKESVKYLLQDPVIEYIQQNGLYGTSCDN